MTSAGNDATALVAFWITLLMMFWNPLVSPLSWFWIVVLMLMSPQMRLLFQPTPTPIERMPAAPLIETALPPPMEYMTSSPMTLPLYWKPPLCANARLLARASVPTSRGARAWRERRAIEVLFRYAISLPHYWKSVEPRNTWPRRRQQLYGRHKAQA